MFDYDRLSLDVKEQFAKTAATPNNNKGSGNKENHNNNKDSLSNGSSESQLFGWDSPSPPCHDEDNAIVHGLSELLRRCSSPGYQQQFGQHHQPKDSPPPFGQFQRHRSATISNTTNEQQMYAAAMISPNLRHHHNQQQQHPPLRNRPFGNALSMDLSNDQLHQQPNRCPSNCGGGGGGGSMNFSDIFDCGASSGYGSPGAIGTPLASPVASATAQYIAHQLQKMYDQGFFEGAATMPINTNVNNGICKGMAASVPPQNGLSTPSAHSNSTTIAAIPTGGPTPILVKATTTTTGTNKNSNKRKTSIANVGMGNGGVAGNGNGQNTPTAIVQAPDTIVATEDGFDTSEIAEFAELLTSPKRQPPARYLCHICYQPGHYISDCPQRFNSPYEELTPYQGRKKCYGEFQCEQCKRKWTSQNSVANEAQSCIKCHVPVFPHKQLPVDKAIALGLVKLQRLPVPLTPTSASTTPIPTTNNTPPCLI